MMLPKKIFVTIPWFYPAFKAGGPIQSILNMVGSMGDDYRFYIFTSNTDLHSQPISITKTGEWIDFSDKCKVWYSTSIKRSETLTAQVAFIKPDVLMMIGVYSWHFTIVPLFFTGCKNKLVSVRGMLHPGALLQKKWKKKVFLSILRLAGIQKRCRFHASDETEADYVKEIFGPTANISVAGNFPRLIPVHDPVVKEKGTIKMVSIGLISPMKNYSLVLEALKSVEGDIDYNIYGPVKDPSYWEECLLLIRALPSRIRVFYHKELAPAKVPSKLAANHIFVLPSKSENFGHAIAEALSCGVPVITSNHTPWNELDEYRAGINADDNVTSIAGALSRFVDMDHETYVQYHKGAATYLRSRIDITEIRNQYIRMFENDLPTGQTYSIE